jgi:Fe-S-cluster-containing dehydrogenase component
MPSFAGNGVMYKCDRCYDQLALIRMPACIEACPEHVQTIGPRDEIAAFFINVG